MPTSSSLKPLAALALLAAALAAPANAGALVHQHNDRAVVGPEIRSVVGPEVRPAATDQSCGDLVGPEIRGVIDPNDRHAAGCVIGPEFTPQH